MRRRRAVAVNTAKALLRGTPLHRLVRRVRRSYERRRVGFDVLYLDTNNVCNLRCPFCFNDWDAVGKSKLMSRETFAKAIALMPLVSDGFFHLSCSFEPTLNPHFLPMLETIPNRHRRSAFFTTNLTTKLSDEFLSRLTRCNLHHINVSVESLVPDIYRACRKNANYERFVENLERLTATFARTPSAPPIYFITVVTTENAESIPDLVRQCATRYGAASHEIRSFSVNDANEKWSVGKILDSAGWDRLTSGLRRSGCRNYVVIPPPSRESGQGGYSAEPPRSRFMIVSADGTARVGNNTEFRAEETFDLGSIADPLAFFRSYCANSMRSQPLQGAGK